MYARAKSVLTAFLVLLVSAPIALAQQYAPQQGQPAFSQQQLDQMLAPIALYPDALLAQILMAATYPVEVVEAARWSRSNRDLNGDRAVRAAERMDWDASVISLVAFPQILDMMDEKLNWTEDLGDAFLDQQAQVIDTVQYLRQKAHAAGNLRSTDQFRVDYEGSTFAITLTNPEVVYLPYYNPTIVYGTWWWPAYQPVYWAPWPGYHARPGYARGYAWGPGIPVARGFFFGAPDWHRRSVNIVNVNTYYYRPAHVNRQTDIARNASNGLGASNAWQHDLSRRRDAPGRDAALRQQSGNHTAAPAARRENRGFESSVVDGRGRSGNRADTPADSGNRRDERGSPQPVIAGHGARPHTERAPAAETPVVARAAPGAASVPATVSRPNIEQRASPASAPDGGARDPEGRSPAARGHDASPVEGRGWSGNRRDGRADSGGRSEERGQHAVASTGALQNAGRGPVSTNPPVVVAAPAVLSAPGQPTAPSAVSRPNAGPQPVAANTAAGGGRRTEPRSVGARESAVHQAAAPVDNAVTTPGAASSAVASQGAANPRSGGGNFRHPQ